MSANLSPALGLKISWELARDPCRNTSQDLGLLKHRSQHFMHTYDTYAHHLHKHHFSPTSCSGVMYPIVASMEIRPCFSSVWRRRWKFSTLPSAVTGLLDPRNPTGCLHTKFVLEGTQRRGGVVGPVSPRASGQTVLHATSSMSIQLSCNIRSILFCWALAVSSMLANIQHRRRLSSCECLT